MTGKTDLEKRLRSEYAAASLPTAPTQLRNLIVDLGVPATSHRGQGRRWLLRTAPIAIALVSVGAIGMLVTGAPAPAPTQTAGVSSPTADPSVDATSSPAAAYPDAMTVSEVLAARAGGQLAGEAVIVTGYWSDRSFGHSCASPTETPGVLQLYCHDGEWGITELNEPVMTLHQGGFVDEPAGPKLTPWLPDDIAEQLFAHSYVTIGDEDVVVYAAPIPIVVEGHFDDPRAEDCWPDARQLCRDRLVVEKVLAFDPESVPLPTPTPVPSPFPYDAPPPPKFGADMCDGDVPYSFVGWTTMADLGIDIGGEGHIFAMVTEEPIPLSDWVEDPARSGDRYRQFGRHVCYAWEWEQGGVGYTVLPGSGYREWEDGRIEEFDGP